MLKDNSSDTCTCRPCCTYPNGVCILIGSQIILCIASLLAVFAVVDCQFVTVDATKVDPFLTSIVFNKTASSQLNNTTERGLGFFVWEEVDGKCVWENSHNYNEATWNVYRAFLGSDWDGPRYMACIAAFCAWVLLIWLFAFCCAAHRKSIRYLFGGLLLIVLMSVFQSISFAVLKSDLCKVYGCKIGRSARFAASAVGLYVLTGILLLLTKDYPGTKTSEPQWASASENHAEQRDIDHLDEEQLNYQNDGIADAREVSVTSGLVDVSLVDSTASTNMVSNRAKIY